MPPGTRILIVDDEEIFAENLWGYFRRRRAEVKVVPSGEAALDVAPEFNPDVLILDYGLPGMDGLETFSRLKGLPLAYGCVLVTGNPSDSVFRAAQATGIHRVLEKPFSFSELEALIASQVAKLSERGRSERRAAERRVSPGGMPSPLNGCDGRVNHERRLTKRRCTSDRRRGARS
jgi:CheY-like chemotaxis protein